MPSEKVISVWQVMADALSAFEGQRREVMVTGSVASSTWGQPRFTRNIDFLSVLREQSADGLPGFDLRTDPDLNLVDGLHKVAFSHSASGFHVNLLLAPATEYWVGEFSRGRSVSVHEIGGIAKFLSPEGVIIQQLRVFRFVQCLRDQQWNDIVQVLEIQKGRLDEDYMFKWAKHFNVDELLTEAMSQTID